LAESEDKFSAERKESLGQTARKLRKIAEKKRENGDRKGTERGAKMGAKMSEKRGQCTPFFHETRCSKNQTEHQTELGRCGKSTRAALVLNRYVKIGTAQPCTVGSVVTIEYFFVC
jgi:hypothetical protein